MKNKTVTLGSDIKNDSITLSEDALHQQLTALGVYDPLISFLECLTILGQTKNETTKSLKREIAEAAYVKQLAAVRKMCGMEQPVPQPQPPKKAEPKRYTNQAYSDEEKATLFD
jgi:hypothetical protein